MMNEKLSSRMAYATERLLNSKGYEVLSVLRHEDGASALEVVAKVDGTMVFIDVDATVGTDGFEEKHASRGDREARAARYLAEHPYLEAEVVVRFDEISFMILADNRAMVRHHIDCLRGSDN